MSNETVGVLFVCLGNICRSPLAEGAFQAHVERRGLGERFTIDSAGTSGFHSGELPDARSVAVARHHGVDISHQRSRQLLRDDLNRFDYILAMDRSNRKNIVALRKPGDRASVSLMMSELEPPSAEEVPDPYYGGEGGFEAVWGMVVQSTEALLDRILEETR